MTDHLETLKVALDFVNSQPCRCMSIAQLGERDYCDRCSAIRAIKQADAAIALMRGQSEEMNRLRQTIDSYERGLISTPYTRALVDQHSNRATQYLIEVIRLNRVVARQSAKIKRMSALLRALLPRPAKGLSR